MSNHQLRSAIAGLVAGSFILFSCMNRNPATSIDSDHSAGFGMAVVQLPDLSSGGLSKSAAGIDTNALTLLIVASDMDTMKYSWPVTSLKGQTVRIDGIPSGANRYFEGFLTNRSGLLTHSGKVSATILAGQQVPVHLRLSGVGGADVCIEIDGYPSSCYSGDSLNVNSCLEGGSISEALTGNIQLSVYGGKTSGQLTLIGSTSKTAYLFIRPVQITGLSDQKLCQTIVLNTATKQFQAFRMVINSYSEFMYGYLFQDSTEKSPTFAKFSGVKCPGTNEILNINSCLKGYTPYDTLTGNIQLYISGKNASGQFILVTSKSKNNYLFNGPVQITDTLYQTNVLDAATKKSHFLRMVINKNSEIVYSYLSADSSAYSEAIAKFTTVKCSPDTFPDTISDTNTLYIELHGKSAYDTSIFSSSLKLTIYKDSAFGTFYSNFSLLKPSTFQVYGTFFKSGNSGSMILTSLSPISSVPPYTIIIKFINSDYEGIINQSIGGTEKIIATLSSKQLTM
jgi:hypothetical protein